MWYSHCGLHQQSMGYSHCGLHQQSMWYSHCGLHQLSMWYSHCGLHQQSIVVFTLWSSLIEYVVFIVHMWDSLHGLPKCSHFGIHKDVIGCSNCVLLRRIYGVNFGFSLGGYMVLTLWSYTLYIHWYTIYILI